MLVLETLVARRTHSFGFPMLDCRPERHDFGVRHHWLSYFSPLINSRGLLDSVVC